MLFKPYESTTKSQTGSSHSQLLKSIVSRSSFFQVLWTPELTFFDSAGWTEVKVTSLIESSFELYMSVLFVTQSHARLITWFGSSDNNEDLLILRRFDHDHSWQSRLCYALSSLWSLAGPGKSWKMRLQQCGRSLWHCRLQNRWRVLRLGWQEMLPSKNDRKACTAWLSVLRVRVYELAWLQVRCLPLFGY